MAGRVARRNEHGVLYHAGPQTALAHRNVFYFWPSTTPNSTRPKGPARALCFDCLAEWDEGALVPQECEEDGRERALFREVVEEAIRSPVWGEGTTGTGEGTPQRSTVGDSSDEV